MTEVQNEGLKQFRIKQLYKQTVPVSDKKKAAAELFPADKRRERLQAQSPQDRNAFGKPVSYFRHMGYAELEALMRSRKLYPGEKPGIDQKFLQRRAELLAFVREFSKEYPAVEAELKDDMSWEDFSYVMDEIAPRTLIYRLHTRYGHGAMFGITSLSVTAPYQTPSSEMYMNGGLPNPTSMVAVEFAIPSSHVIVFPTKTESALQEREKEVAVTQLQNEWMIGVYPSVEDLADRFLGADDSFLHDVYQAELRNSSSPAGTVEETLEKWKQGYTTQDLIPRALVPQLDIAAPVHEQTLFETRRHLR